MRILFRSTLLFLLGSTFLLLAGCDPNSPAGADTDPAELLVATTWKVTNVEPAGAPNSSQVGTTFRFKSDGSVEIKNPNGIISTLDWQLYENDTKLGIGLAGTYNESEILELTSTRMRLRLVSSGGFFEETYQPE